MKAEVRITEKELRSYLFFTTYSSFTGILSVILGIAAIGAGIFYLANANQTGVFFLIMAAVFFVMQPALLLMNAKKQAKNRIFSVTTCYFFNESGITVWQDGFVLPEDVLCAVRAEDAKAGLLREYEMQVNDTEEGEEDPGPKKPEAAHLPWLNIKKVIHFRDQYFIYVDNYHANLVPASSFIGEDAEKRFSEMILRVLPKNRRKGFKA